MDPNELLKAAPEIAKGAGALAAAIPFTSIVKRMLGPAADEVAQMWADQIRVYRYGRQLKLLEKAERMAQDAGYTPQAVPPKILFPLLEGASFEDNEDLHTMWAALLANAASPENADKVRPSFIVILRQMDPHEASVLNRIYEDAQIPVTAENEFRRFGLDYESLSPPLWDTLFGGKSKEFWDVRISVDALMAQQLVGESYWKNEGEGVFTALGAPSAEQVDFTFTLTDRGRAFVEACCPPKPKP